MSGDPRTGLYAVNRLVCGRYHPRTDWEGLNALRMMALECLSDRPCHGVYHIFFLFELLDVGPDIFTELPYFSCSDKLDEDDSDCRVCSRGHFLLYDLTPDEVGPFLLAIEKFRDHYFAPRRGSGSIEGNILNLDPNSEGTTGGPSGPSDGSSVKAWKGIVSSPSPPPIGPGDGNPFVVEQDLPPPRFGDFPLVKRLSRHRHKRVKTAK